MFSVGERLDHHEAARRRLELGLARDRSDFDMGQTGPVAAVGRGLPHDGGVPEVDRPKLREWARLLQRSNLNNALKSLPVRLHAA